MTKEEKLFFTTDEYVEGSVESQLFGKPCFKINGKAFVCFFENEMVFKLSDPEHGEALKLKGAQLFDPSKKGRAMREWVQLPGAHKKHWKKFAAAACAYVAS